MWPVSFKHASNSVRPLTGLTDCMKVLSFPGLQHPQTVSFSVACYMPTMPFKLNAFVIVIYSVVEFLFYSDLSFNNIEIIQGLDKLTKLQDLTLYNNRISRIERMDPLTDLHVFSIGNNNLTDLENVSNSFH